MRLFWNWGNISHFLKLLEFNLFFFLVFAWPLVSNSDLFLLWTRNISIITSWHFCLRCILFVSWSTCSKHQIMFLPSLMRKNSWTIFHLFSVIQTCSFWSEGIIFWLFAEKKYSFRLSLYSFMIGHIMKPILWKF